VKENDHFSWGGFAAGVVRRFGREWKEMADYAFG